MTELDELKERKEKTLNFLKEKKNLVIYLILAFVIWFGVRIRTLNLKYLQDKFLLALDPYVFYRYAVYIAEHGKLFALDTMRYVPLGYNTVGEGGIYVSYLIAYLYKFVHFFIRSVTLIKVDIVYPVIFFCLALIMFFLLVRRLFNQKIALLATAFLAVIPTFLYRTMAGFSEKEPVGIFLMFTAFYFYVRAWQSQEIKQTLVNGILAGLATGFLGLVWGGVQFVFITIALFSLVELALNKFTKKQFYLYSSWFFTFLIVMMVMPSNFTFVVLSSSFTTGIPIFLFFILLLDFILFKLDLLKIKDKIKGRVPLSIVSLGVAFILGSIITTIAFGPSFIPERIVDIKEELLHPMGTSRFVLTVAEAHQPYFQNWLGEFRWFFYVFFIGSILLFYNAVKSIKKYKISLTVLYTLFISGFIFSRFSPNAKLNGVNRISVFLYLGSLILFVSILIFIYLHTFYKDKDTFNEIAKLKKSSIFMFIWFLLTVVGARGGLRLFFVFSPITTILAAYLIVRVFDYSFKTKENLHKIVCWIFIFLVIFAPFVQGSFIRFARTSYNAAKQTGPSFNFQWQNAMSWVRDNTPEDAVFSHWWDYGYWVQTMGERATFLDGGNSITYWDHLMGRHVLTGHSEREALELLYVHNVSYLLIDPTDIGKYPAYTSIGSDENYDRYSYIPTFELDLKDTQETRTETLYLYRGVFALDEDFVYQDKVFPEGGSAIGGFILPIQTFNNSMQLKQPTAVLFYQGQRTDVPLECVFFNEQEINFPGNGVKGCLRIIPTIGSNQQNPIGAAYYVSPKVRKTLFTQLYLFNKQWPHFKEVYNDAQNMPLVKYNGMPIGPIKIWEVSYPANIEFKPEYLETDYPSLALQ